MDLTNASAIVTGQVGNAGEAAASDVLAPSIGE